MNGHPTNLRASSLAMHSVMLWHHSVVRYGVMYTSNNGELIPSWGVCDRPRTPATSEVIKLLSHPPKCKATSGSNRVTLGSPSPLSVEKMRIETRYVCTSNFAIAAIVVDPERRQQYMSKGKKKLVKKRKKKESKGEKDMI